MGFKVISNLSIRDFIHWGKNNGFSGGPGRGRNGSVPYSAYALVLLGWIDSKLRVKNDVIFEEVS